MKTVPLLIAAAVRELVAAVSLAGQEAGNSPVPPPRVTVFRNVRIYDGKSDRLSAPSHVLVRRNRIESISTDPTQRTAGPTPWSLTGKTRRSCRG